MGGWKRAIKALLSAYASNHRDQGQPPILLVSTVRSGSTWVTNLISSQPNIRTVPEPFFQSREQLFRLPLERCGRYLYVPEELSPGQLDALDEFIRSLAHFKVNRWLRANAYVPYRFYTTRTLIKLLRAKTLAGWIEDRLGAQVLFLLRHPLAVTRSRLRACFDLWLDEMLESKQFVERYLTDAQRSCAFKVQRTGSRIERYVVDWCLDNLVPLKLSRARPWLVLTYEEIVQRPSQVARLLCKHLSLKNPGKVVRQLYRPSQTTNFQGAVDAMTDQAIRARERGRDYLLAKWQADFTKDDFAATARILNTFEIDAYRADWPFPSEAIVHTEDESKRMRDMPVSLARRSRLA